MDKIYCDMCDEQAVILHARSIMDQAGGVYFSGMVCGDCIKREENGPQTDEWLEADSQPVPLLDQQMNARKLK